MFSSVFNDNNLFEGGNQTRTSDLEFVINHVFFPANEPSDNQFRWHSDERLLAHTILAAAHAYYEYIDDSHKPQWHHIVQMLSDLCDFPSYGCPPEKVLSQLRGMRGTVSGSL